MSSFRRVTEKSCTRSTSNLGGLRSLSNSERPLPVLKKESPDGSSGEVPNTIFARSDAAEQVGTPPLLYIFQKEKSFGLMLEACFSYCWWMPKERLRVSNITPGS